MDNALQKSKTSTSYSVLVHALRAAEDSGMSLRQFSDALALELDRLPGSAEALKSSDREGGRGAGASSRGRKRTRNPKRKSLREVEEPLPKTTEAEDRKVEEETLKESAPNEGSYKTAKTRYKADARRMRISKETLDSEPCFANLVKYNNLRATCSRSWRTLNERFPDKVEGLKDQLEGYESVMTQIQSLVVDYQKKGAYFDYTLSDVVPDLITIRIGDEVVDLFNTSLEELKKKDKYLVSPLEAKC